MPTADGDTQTRLVTAALELFEERGYERTTVAEIAHRAGLGRRTFFRYFDDKREVLFTQTRTLEQLWARTVAEADPGFDPLETVVAALRGTADLIEPRRAGSVRRHAVLSATPELREREQMKLTRLAELTAEHLETRGVSPASARAASALGVLVLGLAYERWAATPDGLTLKLEMADVLGEIRQLFGVPRASPQRD